ncbi:unnamed protein product [Sphagnum troendelagicum]
MSLLPVRAWSLSRHPGFFFFPSTSWLFSSSAFPFSAKHKPRVKNDQMKLMALIEPGMLWQANCQTHRLQSVRGQSCCLDIYRGIAKGGWWSLLLAGHKRDELASNRFSQEIAVRESSLVPHAVQRRRRLKLLKIREMGFSAICLQGTAKMVMYGARNLRVMNLGALRKGMSTKAPRGAREVEGDWKYSPEWWGSQGGGWGHDAGLVVFEVQSTMDNGVITVTSHTASTPRPENWPNIERELQQRWEREVKAGKDDESFRVMGFEWRVLRFNTVTRQSVAKVMLVAKDGDPSQLYFMQQPNCVAFEYVKSMLSVGLATVSLGGLKIEQVANGTTKMRILCVGLGGGSLPLFLAHNLPGATVEVVEIDHTVIEAATEAMGFPPCYGGLSCSQRGPDPHEEVLWGSTLRNMVVYEGDGEDFVLNHGMGQISGYYDMVFVDAYDGHDTVPLKLWCREGPFLTALSHLLHPHHGTVVVNLHSDAPFPSLLERLSGQYGPGFDPQLPLGSKVQEACLNYRDALLNSDSDFHGDTTYESSRTGIAFTVAVPLQGNVCLVVSRGVSGHHIPGTLSHNGRSKGDEAVVRALTFESKQIENLLDSQLGFSQRIARGFQVVKEPVKKAKIS